MSKIVQVRCMSLPKGVPVTHFDTLKEALEHLKGDELKVVDLLNKYGRQKDSLVNAREFLSQVVNAKGEYILKDGRKFAGVGFPIHDRKTKAPLTGDDKKDDPETDTDHLERFVEAVVKGQFSLNGYTVTGKEDKEKEKSVWMFLQGIIDQHKDFPFDLNQADRVGKVKNPPKYAVDAATSIINGGADRVKEWTEKFTKGYESKGYGMVEPISFSPFNVVAPKGAKPEDVEKTRQSNITALAWAITAVEEQKRANTAKKEYF